MSLAQLLDLKVPLVVLDLETTGVHLEVDRIVQIAVQKHTPEGQVTEWSSLVNPGIPIPPEATAVHHIDDVKVATAPHFADIAVGLRKAFHTCDIAGYNVGFDIKFLNKAFAGVRQPELSCRVVDAFRIFSAKHPRNLTAAVSTFLDEDMVDAHDAAVDVKYTTRVLEALLVRYPDVPRDVEDLHRQYNEAPQDDYIDPEGRVGWRHNEAVLTFGKHPGVPLYKVPASYLRWICTSDFGPGVKTLATKALNGQYFKRDALGGQGYWFPLTQSR